MTTKTNNRRKTEYVQEETIMRALNFAGCCLVLCCGLSGLVAICTPQSAAAQDTKGKNCRMEQQCHWQDFKKICVWVKVCR